jgi:hypothetical protein
MYPGGISDKQGNRYEELWIILHFLRVLRGKHLAITVEKLGKENDGFEFHIQDEDGSEKWLQSKINAQNGNWTLKALMKSGVLDAFRARLKDPTCSCLFVSQDGTNLLREACNDARLAGSLQVYKDQASSDRKDALTTFSEGITGEGAEDMAFDHLTRCYFENASMAVLKGQVADLGNFLFRNSQHVEELVIGFLNENINREITTEDARNWARNQGILKLRPDLDPTAVERLAEANIAYFSSHSKRRFGEVELDRGYARKVLESIENDASLVMISGVAGSGKTIAVHQLTKQAISAGFRTLALRLDKRLDASTPQELGEVNDLPESPASFLARLAQGEPALLIIDQIDAVSELSGRSASVRDALFATLREAALHPNLCCVLVCRDYDLEGDDQFRALLDDKASGPKPTIAERIRIGPLSWEDEILPTLKARGIDGKFSASQKTLLSSPLNLSVLLSIEEHDFRPETQSELFRALLEQVQRKNNLMPLRAGLDAMALWMSDRHQLRCPDAVLHPFPGLKDWMASEGLVIVDGRFLHFMHESLFDHIFAFAFMSQGKSILEFLTSSEQSLFRRTQIRQIFQEARSLDHIWYLNNLRDLICSNKVRPHIKLAIARWLSQVTDPTQDEFDIILATDKADEAFGTVIRNAFMSGPVWIPMLEDRNFIQDALMSPVLERYNHASWWFARNAGDFPELSAKLMREWWQSDATRTDALTVWFGLVNRKVGDVALASLLVEVLQARPPQLFQGGKDRIGMLLPGWVEDEPDGVNCILEELMACWFDAHPNMHPFSYDAVKDLDLYHFGKLAEKAPVAFLTGVMPTILKTLDLLENSDDLVDKWRFSLRYRNGRDDLITIIFAAFRAVAVADPAVCENLLLQIDPQRHEVIAHLWLVCVANAPEQLAKHLGLLSQCDYILSCGHNEAKYQAFSEAARALVISGACPPEDIEAFFIDMRPEHKIALQHLAIVRGGGEGSERHRSWAVEILQDTGRTVWGILSEIGRPHLSVRGQETYDQLQRKFSNLPREKLRSSGIRQVVSPLSKETTAVMTDDQWLSAIKKYATNDWRGKETDGTVEGGARHLAQLLSDVAKTDPIRFLGLAVKIPEGAHSSYLTSCIGGVSSADSIDTVQAITLVLELYKLHRDTCGRQLCELVSRHSELASSEAIVQMCLWYTEHGDGPMPADQDLEQARERTVKLDQILSRGSNFLVSGDVDAKTCAWMAVSCALWLKQPKLDLIWPVLSSAVDNETSLVVRMSMLEPFRAIYNLDPDKFKDGLNRLTVARGADEPGEELYPLAGHTGFDLARFISHAMPETARGFMVRMMASADDLLDHIGAWWAMVHALNYELDADWIEAIKNRSPEHLRLWVELLSQCAATTEFRNFAIEELGAFFNHEDREIRGTAVGVFWNIKPEDFRQFENLAIQYVQSRSLLDGDVGFFHLLEETTAETSELVLSASESLIKDIAQKGDGQGSRSGDLHRLQDLLRKEYLASEGRESRRKRVLDLIDEMIENGLYETEELLDLGEK